jgi:hypothetical protein
MLINQVNYLQGYVPGVFRLVGQTVGNPNSETYACAFF